MKIFINRRLVDGPWGGGNKFVRAMLEHAPKFNHIVTNNLMEADIDIVHIQGLRSDSLGVDVNKILIHKKESRPNIKGVHRVNDMDLGRHDHLPWRKRACLQTSAHTDATVFVSEWTKEYFIKEDWRCDNTHVIYNGVDKEVFQPRKKLDNNKINIVTHHWSNNQGKGFEIYEKIDKFVKDNRDFNFTYIGRERGTFENTNVVSPLFGAELGEELSKYGLYISASEYENCPNHILESLACDIPTYACSLGGASLKLVGEDHVFDNWDELQKIILSKEYIKNTYVPSSWEECMKEYFEFYEQVLNGEV